MAVAVLVSAATIAGAATAEAKSGSTIYTPERVETARENIRDYAWARRERDTRTGYAAYWLNFSDEELWNLPVEQTVPRGIYVNKTLGCPIHGKALIDKYGVYGWKVDPKNHPWKVQCPIGGERWPTNDFGAYYRSGKDGKNVFQASLANRGLLYSTDSTRNYGVDDGTGYRDANGNRYDFIAFYAHWGVWQNLGRSWSQALVNLSEAYVLTGDKQYAHKAAVLLSRIADLLPTMDTNYWATRGYYQGDGLSYRGLALGSLWDAVLASSIARAYDAIYPAIQDDPALYSFLHGKAVKHGLTPVDTPARLAAHIEKNALEVLLRAIQDRRIRANEGVHQKAYAEAAIALDSPRDTPVWLDWLMRPGDVYNGDGHLPAIFVDWIDRDGASDEAAPGYNWVWLEQLQPLADLLEDSPYAEGFSLTQYPNFRNFLSFPYWLQLTPQYYPHIGDDGATGNPGLVAGSDANRFAAAFHRYGFPELAQMAHALNGGSSEGLHGGIFDPGADSTAAAIDKIVAERGALERESFVKTGYGLAAFLGKSADNHSAVWLYSGRMGKHGHWDRLNMGLMAYGINLMPDLGYPDFPTVDSPNYWGWQNNTVSHNTVVVDAKRQATVKAGTTHVFSGDRPIKVVEADGNGVYPQSEVYRRSIIQIPAGKGGFYLVDLFRIKGGKDHLYSFHAGPGAVNLVNGLNMSAQSGGTYAGANIPFGSFYDGSCCTKYTGSGFQFMDSVYRDNAPSGDYAVEWQVTDNWNASTPGQDTRLKLWSASDKPSNVALAKAYPPSNKPGNPSSVRYLLERRQASSDLTTTFVHIIEPSVGGGTITSVERFTPEPATDAHGFARVGLRISHADGRVDTVVHGLDPAAVTTPDGLKVEGRGAVVLRKDGKTEMSYLLAGKQLVIGDEGTVTGAGVWKGTVRNLDTSDPDNTRLIVSPVPPKGKWIGRYLRVDAPGSHDPFYRIRGIESGSGDTVVVNLGRISLARGHVNMSDYTQGYQLDVKVGDSFEVQGATWVAGASNPDPEVDPPYDTSPTDGSPDVTPSEPEDGDTGQKTRRSVPLSLAGCGSKSTAQASTAPLFAFAVLGLVRISRRRR